MLAAAAPTGPNPPSAPPTELLHISLDKIRLNPVALRDVQRKEQEFTELVDSVRRHGVMSAISVIRKPGADGKEFELVDGLQRFSASQEAGRPTIPAQVLVVQDAERIIAQVIGNAVRLETKPVEYAKALMKILGYNPTWTEAELASKVSKSPAWINRQLGLLRLNQKAKILVDDNRIPVANAYVLAKLPEEEQDNWIERAQTQQASEFTQAVLERAKQIKEANRKGQEAGEEKVAALLQDERVIRNRLKIRSAVKNARAFLAVREESGSFDTYIWQFVGGKPRVNCPQTLGDIPAESDESRAMSKDLMRRGFSFVGSTICYAFMQACGLVDDHSVRCFKARCGR